MILKHKLSSFCLVVGMTLAGPVFAQSSGIGFNTMGADLPLGAGGNIHVTISPNGTVRFPILESSNDGTVYFPRKSSYTAFINSTSGSANFKDVTSVTANATTSNITTGNITNLKSDSAAIKNSMTVGNVAANAATINAANVLRDALASSGCSVGSLIAIGANGTLSCTVQAVSACTSGTTKSCAVTNGSGSQTCSSGSWGACTVSSCNSGYTNNGSGCVSTPTPTPAPVTPSYTYSWTSGAWGSCALTSSSVYCSGTQTRTVTCYRSDGVIVSNGYCSAAKPSTSQSCTYPTASTEPAKGKEYLFRYADLSAAFYSYATSGATHPDTLYAKCSNPSIYPDGTTKASCYGLTHYLNHGNIEHRCY